MVGVNLSNMYFEALKKLVHKSLVLGIFCFCLFATTI